MAEDWQKLRVLVAGCGSIGKRHARVLREIGVQTLFAADPVAAQVAAAAKETRFDATAESFEAGLALKPQAVVLCTPPALHVPQAVQALEAGCHVFSEKPLSVDLRGVPELERTMTRTGLTFAVGLCFRWHDGLLRAREILRSGRIGRLAAIRSLMGEHLPDIRPDYRDLYIAKSNGAFELMHDIDLCLWYAGQDVQSVCGTYGGFSDIGIQAPDLVEMVMVFPDRCVASVHLDFFEQPRRRQIELLGTRGTLTVEFASWTECTVSVFDQESRDWQVETITTDRDDMFRDQDSAFLRAAAGLETVTCTLAEARKSLRAVLMLQGKETR